jgi:hypothetical protein
MIPPESLRDVDDLHVLGCAVAARADAVVSGDKDLFCVLLPAFPFSRQRKFWNGCRTNEATDAVELRPGQPVDVELREVRRSAKSLLQRQQAGTLAGAGLEQKLFIVSGPGRNDTDNLSIEDH